MPGTPEGVYPNLFATNEQIAQANGFVPEALLMVLRCRPKELAGDLELLGVGDSLAQ